MKTELVERCNVCGGEAIETVDPACDIAKCAGCGYVFDNPRPTLEELVKFYSRPTQYDSWLARLGPRQRLWKRRLAVLRSTRKPGSLLDVGAGIGQFLALARDFYGEVHGTEVSSIAIQIAKQEYGLELLIGTIEDLDMSGKVFDNVTLFHVLEHVPDPASVLRTCRSVLSAEGILVIAVPNEVASLRAFMRKILVKAGLKKQGRVGIFGLPRIRLDQDTAEVHLSHFTPRVLRHLLRGLGFTIVKETIDPYYVATGFEKMKADIYYYFCLACIKVFRTNIYDTILVIARKEASVPNAEQDRGRRTA